MNPYLAMLLIGVIAGLRAMTAPAAVSWAVVLGRLHLDAGWLGLLGHRVTAWILTLLALGELVSDQLPSTPSRKVPVQSTARVLAGALCGAAVGSAHDLLAAGLAFGAVGAVLGTLGGAALRARLAAALGRDRPAALIEDGVAILGAALIVWAAA
jgi:uncharacterized membrane protein